MGELNQDAGVSEKEVIELINANKTPSEGLFPELFG
jgi:hypothetical protein